MVRVQFWTEWFWPAVGGVEVISKRLLVDLRERGHEVFVMTSKGPDGLPDEEIVEGLHVHRLPFQAAITGGNPLDVLETVQRASELKRKVAPDLVHLGIIGTCAFFHLQTTGAHACPTLVTRQDLLEDPTGAADTVFGRVLRAADWIACCSQAMCDETLGVIPEVASRCSVIRNGVDPPTVAPTALALDPPTLAAFGRLVPEKGFDVAIKAMDRILETFPDARLLIAGDGPERQQLESLAMALGVSHAIEFRGLIDPRDVPSFLNESALVLQPSRVEAFGLTALEAALMGRTVVASAVGGLCEVVADGRSGRLVEPDDPADLARTVIDLLHDPSTLTALGRQARERARDEFTWESYVDAYDALYQRLATAEVTT